MQKCSFPLCPRYGKGDYCLFHEKIYSSGTAKGKEQQKSLPELTELAQKSVNGFVRRRDEKQGCITCGSPVQDAGHYIPVGENSALRFDVDNIWGQCSSCNVFKGGNRKIYRVQLIEKIGLERVVELETAAKYCKWTREQLEAIIEQYKFTKEPA